MVRFPLTLTLTLTLTLALLVGLAPPAAAQEDDSSSWFHDRYTGDTPSETAATLIYGLPQTDGFLFAAHCLGDASPPQIEAVIGAQVDGLADDQPVQIQFFGRAYDQVIDARVLFQQEGVYGVRFSMGTEDRFWVALAGQSDLRYQVIGQPDQTIALQGSAGPVLAFLSDCHDLGVPTQVSGTIAAQTPAPLIGDNGCNRYPGLRSKNSDTPQAATFVNVSEGFRVLAWLDFNGLPVEYARLNQGESFTVNTYLLHSWMITDGPGNCIQIFEPQPGVSRYEIAARSPDFGSE